MSGLLPVYLALFVVLTVAGILTETRLGFPRWKVATGALAAGLGAAGIVFVWRDAVTPGLVRAWRVVFPLIVLQAVVGSWWDLRHGLRIVRAAAEGEDGVPEGRSPAVAFVVGLVALAPYFWINYRLAFA